MAGHHEGEAGYLVPARFLPVPRTVSPQAQAALQVVNPFGAHSEPDPADKAAWKARLEAAQEPFARMLRERFGAFAPASQVEHRLAHATLYEIEPANPDPHIAGKALFYVHGGGFTAGGGEAAAMACWQLAGLTRLRTFSIDYRMPPDHPFPAGLDDAVEAYRLLVDRFGAANLAAYGPSAGGGLIASALLKARDQGLAMPAVCVLHSPEADLTESGDSFSTNLGVDPILGRLTNSIALYANGHDLKDPYLSPLYGDFAKGFPPVLISTGTRDLFLSNAVLLHRALRRAGIPAQLSVWEAMGHAGFLGMAPEDRELIDEQVAFLREGLGATA